MAVGFPLKTTYANGDVYSASDVNDTNGTLNLLGSSVAYTAGKNIIINGNFDFWQRGTTYAAIPNLIILADRFKTSLAGTSVNATYSRDTNVPNTVSLYSAKLQQLTSSATSVTEFGLFQILEAQNTFPLLGKTVTLSFWYRSNKTGNHYARLFCNQTGGTDVTTAFTVSAANTWEKKTITFSSFAGATAISTAPTDSGGGIQIGLNLYPNASITVAANDYFQIAQVQLEQGSTATAFQRAGGTIQGELAACQRYYEKSINLATTPGTTSTGEWWFPNGTIANGETYHLINFAVTKRTDPTVTTYSYSGTSGRAANDSGTNYGADSANVWRAYETYAIVKNNSGSSMTVTSVRWVYCNWTASAEL
jgi:hypothetical protein